MVQGQQLNDPSMQPHPRRKPGWMRWLVALILLLLIAGGAIFWLVETQGSFYSILPVVIFTVLGVIIGLLQWLFPVGSGMAGQSTALHPALQPQGVMPVASPPLVQPIIVHIPAPAPAPADTHPLRSEPLDKPSYRGIRGVPPLTDPRTIQQREQTVQEIFARMSEAGVTALVLTGIGGVGKSTLAALVYRYAEAQRRSGNGPFTAAAAWLTIDHAATMVDLAGNLFEVFGKPLPDFATLSLEHQAMALFNVLNTAEQPRLVILDQFENLLDIQSGHALADRPGVGEWLDDINSQPCTCKILLTSRPWPQGTREYPSTYMQEYIVKGLETAEGMELLRKLQVEASDAELRSIVEHCQGHAFALTLLATLLRSRHLNLSAFSHDPIYRRLWSGNVARNLLDAIYKQQLNEEQRRLLLAFSVYRKPVHLDAAEALTRVDGAEEQHMRMHHALDALLNQHVLQAMGDECYQLHAIVASYAHECFVETDEAANRQALLAAHARAAQHFVDFAATHSPAREQRRLIADVEPLIEAVWQLCQAERWLDAFDLMEREGLFLTLKRAGGCAIMLELYQGLSLEKWQPTPEQRARIYDDLGVIYRVLGRMEQATNYLERALQLFKDNNNRLGEARVLGDLGRVSGELGSREHARGDYEASLRIFQEERNPLGEGFALNNLGWECVMLGQDQQAQLYYERALAIFQELGDQMGEAGTLNNLGRVYEDLGQLEEAQAHYEQAMHIFQEQHDRKGIAWSLNNLGKAFRKMGKYDQSLAYLEQSLAIRRELDRKGEGRTCKNLGAVYEIRGEKETALGYYKQSLAIAREVQDREGEGKTLRNIGKLFLDQQRYDVSLATLLLARAMLVEMQSTYFDEAERGIATVHRALGDEAYAALLATVEPRAAALVEQAL